jgi:hypothetical protein
MSSLGRINGIGDIDIYRTDTNWGTVWFVLYAASNKTSFSDWHEVRTALHGWAGAYLPSHLTKTLAVDSDEFLYLRDVALSEAVPSLGLHFVDIVPDACFPDADLRFCIQPWYFRRQATKWYLRHAKPLIRRPLLAILAKTNRLVTHEGCKTFYFERSAMVNGESWHHGTRNCFSTCGCVLQDNSGLYKSLDGLKSTGFVYHFSNPSFKHFKQERLHVWARLQTDAHMHSPGLSVEHDNISKLHRSWKQHYEQPLFPVFKDNFLKRFLPNAFGGFISLSRYDAETTPMDWV